MKRCALVRQKPLRARPPAPRPRNVTTYSPRPRAVATASRPLPMATPSPKDLRIRSESYRRLVAALPCAHCGAFGFSQAAHGDEGKGLGIKACDSTCYPACGPRPGIPGCHWLIGTSGAFSRAERRQLERRYASETRAALGVDERLRPRIAATPEAHAVGAP